MTKYDTKQREFVEYKPQKGWHCLAVCFQDQEIVNCANCGKQLPFGHTFASRTIKNKKNVGYGVCPECYSKEYFAVQIMNGNDDKENRK